MKKKKKLPPPPVPENVDLRDVPFPLESMSQAAAACFGISVDEAREQFRRIAKAKGIAIDEGHHE